MFLGNAVSLRFHCRFFENLFDEFGRKERTLRFYSPPTLNNTLFIPLQDLHEALKSLELRVSSEEEQLEVSAAASRVFEFNNTISALLNQNMKDYVYWLEVTPKKRFTRATLRGMPININGWVSIDKWISLGPMGLHGYPWTSLGIHGIARNKASAGHPQMRAHR